MSDSGISCLSKVKKKCLKEIDDTINIFTTFHIYIFRSGLKLFFYDLTLRQENYGSLKTKFIYRSTAVSNCIFIGYLFYTLKHSHRFDDDYGALVGHERKKKVYITTFLYDILPFLLLLFIL